MSTVALITPAAAQYPYPPFPPNVVPDYAPQYRWEGRPSPQMPENHGKQGTPNNASSGKIGLGNPNVVGGECAIGMSEERADGVDGLITHRASIDQTP